jgi:hypothetical protein
MSMAASPATSYTAAVRARSLPALWAETYPDLPVPTIRFWVIFNNQLRPPKAGVFIQETMNALADLGERMGADPARWRTEAP